MKFIHITDPHLVPPGELLWGLNTFERLEACLADIAERSTLSASLLEEVAEILRENDLLRRVGDD